MVVPNVDPHPFFYENEPFSIKKWFMKKQGTDKIVWENSLLKLSNKRRTTGGLRFSSDKLAWVVSPRISLTALSLPFPHLSSVPSTLFFFFVSSLSSFNSLANLSFSSSAVLKLYFCLIEMLFKLAQLRNCTSKLKALGKRKGVNDEADES